MSVTDALGFNKTKMFAKIRQGLTRMQHSQSIIDCKDDLLYAWESYDSCLLVINWRAMLLKSTTHQTLVPSTPQNFDVERVVCSNEGSLIALAGTRGVAILEVPRRWGKDGQFMEGKPKISCRTYSIDSMLFSNNPNLEVRQVRWHPASTTDSHLLVLLSDNSIRLYNNAQLQQVWRVGPMPILSNTKMKPNSSFGTFGETAVDFDIAPAVKTKAHLNEISTDLANISLNQTNQNISNQAVVKKDKVVWPIIVLRENGNIYVLMAGLNTEKTSLQGPMTITPEAVDNYGLDSCAILVIPSVPTILILAESNGRLHHALFLEAEDLENSFNEVDFSLNIQPSEWKVHVLETVELELGLPKTESETTANYTCPIYLKRDYINEMRYFAYHNTGLHVVSVNFLSELQRFLESETANDALSLSTASTAEYILCTKIDSSENVNVVLGFIVLQSPASLVVLLGSGQVISLKVVIDAKLLVAPDRTLCQSVAMDNTLELLTLGPNFIDHIRSILQRSITQPILSADKLNSTTNHECYELLTQAVEVLREQYLKRHEQVRIEFSKRINRINLLKEQQLSEIEFLEGEREVIRERAHKLAERFEEVSGKQEILAKKCHHLIRQANIVLPGNVAAEREFTQEVARINKVTKNLAASLANAKKTLRKHNYHIEHAKNSKKCKTFELPEKQQNLITDILKEMATEIEQQIKDIKRINKLVGI